MIILFCFFLIFILVFYAYWPSSRKLPPGPPCWPIIGSLPSVLLADAKRPSIAFKKLGKMYGPIFSLKMGFTPVVVVNGYKEVVEMLHAEELRARIGAEEFWLVEKSESLHLGIIFSSPDIWSKTRQFTERSLRKFGFSEKYNMERIMLEEMLDFCKELSREMINETNETTLEIGTQFDILFLNITWTLLTGKKYSSDNKETQNILHDMNSYVTSGQYGSGIATIFPKLVRSFPNATGFTKLKKICAQWRASLNNAIETIRSARNNPQEPENFIEEFLLAIENTPPPAHVLDSIYTRRNLEATLQDLVLAGTHTVARVVKFFIRFIVQKPELQQILQEEVDNVVGKNNYVTTDHLARLTYVKAISSEVLRCASIADTVTRKLLTDFNFGQYVLPKGTLLLINMFAANTDPKVWSNPEEFNPNRFLSPSKELVNIEKVVSFGFGKRRCVGEQMAKTASLFMIVTLIQQFSFHIDPKFGMPTEEVVQDFVRDTPPFSVKIKKRI